MGSDVSVPEEAVRVLAQSLWWAEHGYGQALGADWVDVGGERRERLYDHARFALREAAPAIRSQERERVLGEVEKRFVDGDLPERIEAAVRKSEREWVRAALGEQIAEYKREADEAEGRGDFAGEDKLRTAANVVECVTRIIFDTGADHA